MSRLVPGRGSRSWWTLCLKRSSTWSPFRAGKKPAARAILGEIGIEMGRFGSRARLASWAGRCPGNNESAEKRRSGKTRKANRYLRRILLQCAWATTANSRRLSRRWPRRPDGTDR
ncbi:MAG: IS110 family transposase [Candidatus Schekmanbacteria bacterium]|nr:IS110 family transposase [Candidatus Schekmanbacteria bacterium]